jgi:1,4-dihydroxy-2-naphthoate polyprenyltransferase
MLRSGAPNSISSPAVPEHRSGMNAWVAAARPRTLWAAVTPVIVGTSTARMVNLPRAFAALVVALSLQIAVNFANDLYDGLRGIDTAARTGPRRAVASGLISPRAMRNAMFGSILVGCLAGLLLAIAVGLELLIVGLASIAAALAYSGGPRPYGSAALGELFVFVFFGLVATVGSAYVQTEQISSIAIISAVSVGLLAAAILVVNNLRDRKTDASAGKVTMAVRLGTDRTITLYTALILGAYPPLVLIAGVADSAWPLLSFATLPLTRGLILAARRGDPSSLVHALSSTARLEFAFGVMLAVGIWIS